MNTISKIKDTLVVIPARAGSKGVKDKNIKKLNSKPLISYTLEYAIRNFEKKNIFVSTNCNQVIEISKKMGLDIPFKRPEELSKDDSPIHETLIHVIEHFEQQGLNFSKLIMLQPTSPFRKELDVHLMCNQFKDKYDLMVSVVIAKSNPYFTLFEDNDDQYLVKSKPSNYFRRQDCPIVYEFNGSIFIFKIASLKKGYINTFQRIKKFEMEEKYSIDIDDEYDWRMAELLMKEFNLK